MEVSKSSKRLSKAYRSGRWSHRLVRCGRGNQSERFKATCNPPQCILSSDEFIATPFTFCSMTRERMIRSSPVLAEGGRPRGAMRNAFS